MKRTYEPKYWNHKGKYQKLYEELREKYVPKYGEAETEHGEIVRIVSRLYYDIYNNGAWNFGALEDERRWLVKHSPESLKAGTIRFITKPQKEMIGNQFYREFLDKYVDAAILWAASLERLSKLEL